MTVASTKYQIETKATVALFLITNFPHGLWYSIGYSTQGRANKLSTFNVNICNKHGKQHCVSLLRYKQGIEVKPHY